MAAFRLRRVAIPWRAQPRSPVPLSFPVSIPHNDAFPTLPIVPTPAPTSTVIPPPQELWFETHEWGKHGTCAGVADATDFFTQVRSGLISPHSLPLHLSPIIMNVSPRSHVALGQGKLAHSHAVFTCRFHLFTQVCSLSSAPLEVLSASRAAGKSLPQMQSDLESAGFAVFSVDTANYQFELSACASNDGVWKLAPVSRFPALCNGTVPPQPPPDPPPSPALTCKPFTHGPPCVTDLDCASAPHCVRCARSGFCTDVKLPPILLD